MRRLRGTIGLATIVLACWGAGPATAGGASFDFERPTYQPGDRAFAWSTLYDLDAADAGPYGAWLSPVSTGTWGELDADDVYVADLVLHDGRYEPSNLLSPAHATVEFTVPDLPPGEYTIVNCNWPCTEGIMDITWGGSFQIPGPAAATTTTTTTTTTSSTAPPTTTTTPPSTTATPTSTTLAVQPLVAESGGSGPPAPVLALGGAAGVALTVGAVYLLLRDRVPRQPTVNPG
jgi:hypothetical protein